MLGDVPSVLARRVDLVTSEVKDEGRIGAARGTIRQGGNLCDVGGLAVSIDPLAAQNEREISVLYLPGEGADRAWVAEE